MKIGEETVITIVTDRLAIVNSSISKLKSVLKSTPNPFVRIDAVNNGDLLLFYVKQRCLIIQFKGMLDSSITFIGPRNITQKYTLSNVSGGRGWKIKIRRIVDVGYLTGKLCKKPNLLSSTLEELLDEVGVEIKKSLISEGSIRPNWQSSSILSEEEVKLAMYEVHSCYQIASKIITDATSATMPPVTSANLIRAIL
ncbi:hypothetical protein KY285_024931 [Solanum tuberosum]|nr:hypothetical protein KY285_024931 [Solanum tuberosum]